MNRGWTFNPARPPAATLVLKLLYKLARTLGFAKALASARGGAPFIIDLRVQWLTMVRHEARAGTITVVQLLGTLDDVVSPEDDIDFATGSEFFYLDVPSSGHANVIDLDDPTWGPVRKAAFALALKGSKEDLVKNNAVPASLPRHAKDPSVHDVLFVIHGIRDYGFWTSHLARRVIHRAVSVSRDNLRVVAALTPTYGYFAMLPFLLPSTRREKIRWFMEQYVDALARFPNAQNFSFVGHSNGTYLLAGALTGYRCCHFHNVVFAGSVVSSNFDWKKQIEAKRVRRVLNYVATADWVVALFPRFLGQLETDLGGAGFDGFRSSASRRLAAADVHDVKFVHGGHGAGLEEKNWDSIARFIVDDEVPTPRPDGRMQSAVVRGLARAAPLVWLALLAVVLWPLALFWPLPHLDWTRESGSLSARCLAAIAWLSVVRAVLTRT